MEKFCKAVDCYRWRVRFAELARNNGIYYCSTKQAVTGNFKFNPNVEFHCLFLTRGGSLKIEEKDIRVIAAYLRYIKG